MADLVTDDGVGAVQERLSDMRNPVHLLVNNAGHGLASEFLESDLDDERDLLRLHVQTTMELTHTAARAMVRRRAGRIINVASVAASPPPVPIRPPSPGSSTSPRRCTSSSPPTASP